MTGEIKKGHTIGKHVYRKWRHPGRDDYWYETYFVEKITPKQVHIYGLMGERMILRRRSLEISGYAISTAHQAVFYAEMPEEYEKQTIGYLMAEGPREVLGLRKEFTQEQLKDAYRKRALETHPDRGGNPTEFLAVQGAYERLSDGPSLGEILRFAEGKD